MKAHRAILDRAIERRGLEPDVPMAQNAKDPAAGRDTVLEAAWWYLVQTQVTARRDLLLRPYSSGWGNGCGISSASVGRYQPPPSER